MPQDAKADPWAEERALLEKWRRCLRGIAPARCPPLMLICSCEDCIAPDDLARIEGAAVEAVDYDLTGAYFGAAGGFRRDGSAIGGGGPASDGQDEARFFFVKLAEALIDSVMDDSENSTIRRNNWFVEPCYWHERLLATRFVEALDESEREGLNGFFRDLVNVAHTRRSPRLWDCLEHGAVFSDALPGIAGELRGLPLYQQVTFWGAFMGGYLHTPAGKEGSLSIDLREHGSLMLPEDAAPLVEAFCNPALGRYLHLAALRLRDEKPATLALKALTLWENSVDAMRLPYTPPDR